MTIETCPQCGARAAPSARYCPDCYLVFSTRSFAEGRTRRAKGGAGGRALAFAGFLFAAIVGAWFVSIDPDDWSAEPGSLQAMARDAKRHVIGAGNPAGREGRPVARDDVRQTGDGCAITQRVTNHRAEAVSPVITFSFLGIDGTRIGRPITAAVTETLPPGASRDLTFHVPCPEMFASAQVRAARRGVDVLAPAHGAQAAARERLEWLLENDNRLPCAFGAACEVVIRFASGDLANYIVERGRGGQSRFFALDQRGTDLLAAAHDAELVVRSRGGTREIPIRRRGDARWSIAAEEAARRDPGNEEGP